MNDKPLGEYEPRTRDAIENRDKILKALSDQSLTFGELLEETDLPKGTLGRHLKKLLRHRQVFKNYNYDREKDIYSASDETIIKKIILPELMSLIATNTLYALLKHGEIKPHRTHWVIEEIRRTVEEYKHRKISNKEILDVLMSTKQYRQHLKIPLLYEKVIKQEKEKEKELS